MGMRGSVLTFVSQDVDIYTVSTQEDLSSTHLRDTCHSIVRLWHLSNLRGESIKEMSPESNMCGETTN